MKTSNITQKNKNSTPNQIQIQSFERVSGALGKHFMKPVWHVLGKVQDTLPSSPASQVQEAPCERWTPGLCSSFIVTVRTHQNSYILDL